MSLVPEVISLLEKNLDTKAHLQELLQQIRRRVGVLPFVGAGMSMPFGLPGWGEFLLELADRAHIGPEIAEMLAGSKYEDAAGVLRHSLGPRHFEDLLATRFGDHAIANLKPEGAVYELTKFPDGPVVTTNFDRVLEKVYQQAGKSLISVWHSQASKGSQALQQDRPFLLKLHGDWEDAKTRILTLEEYSGAYGDSSGDKIDFIKLPIPRLLFTLLSSRVCLFLGCSLRQDRIVKILKTIALGVPDLVHYAVVEEPEGSEEMSTRAAELSGQNIRPIWYPHNRHELVQPILAYLAAKAIESLKEKANQLLSQTPAPVAVPNNLPTSPTTKLFGRDSELLQVADMLRAAQLVTILGVGGCGKSRLALELGRKLIPRYDAGVWFIPLADLAPKADKEKVLPVRIGRIIGVPEQAGRPPNEALVEHLRDRKILIILDNCEHLQKSCREVVGYLLSNCPDLTILATSRRPIKLAEQFERIYPLSPLEVLDENGLRLDQAISNPAVQLFAECAATRLPGYMLTEENFSEVAKLCCALEGIPLAIEVAAARLSVRAVEEMNQESNALLSTIGNIRNGDLRPWKTLTAALRWSYGLLTHTQQLFLRSVSVFDGGWTAKSAEAVYLRPEHDFISVLDHLQMLHDDSLITSSSARRVKRFRFLEPVRQMVQMQVSAEERAEFRLRHAQYFLGFAEEAAPDLLSSRQGERIETMQFESDNFRAAIRWAMESRSAEIALRLIAALWRFTEIRGNFTEGRERALDALRVVGSENFPALRSKVASGAGMLAYRQADFDQAEELFQISLQIEENLPGSIGLANAFNDLGNVARMKGEYKRSQDLYARSLILEIDQRNQRGIAVAKYNLGCLSLTKGDFAAAENQFDESFIGFEVCKDERDSAFPLTGLSQVYLALGDLESAERYARKALTIRTKLNDAKGRAESLAILGFLFIERNNPGKAYEQLCESIKISQGLMDSRGISEALDLFAILYTASKQYSDALQLFANAEKIRGSFTYSPSQLLQVRRQESITIAKATLGDQMHSRAWRRGALLPVADAVELALGPSVVAVAHSAR